MALLRELIGAELRHARTAQRRTLREVAAAANVSLGHLSDLERGRKEVSSELLDAILAELRLSMPGLLSRVSARAQLAGSERPLVALSDDAGSVTEIAA